MVTGPSFMSSTFINAPNSPSLTCTFSEKFLTADFNNNFAFSGFSDLINDGLLPLEISANRVNWLTNNIDH